MEKETRWLTVSEVARVLEMSEITVREWVDKDVLKGYTYLGPRKVRRIYITSVRDLLARSGNPPRQVQLLEQVIEDAWDGPQRRSRLGDTT